MEWIFIVKLEYILNGKCVSVIVVESIDNYLSLELFIYNYR